MSYHSSQDPEEKLPEWLKSLRKRQSGEGKAKDEEEKSSAEPEQSKEADEPDWLRDIRRRHQSEESGSAVSEKKAEPSLGDTQPNPPARPLEKRRLTKEPEPEVERGNGEENKEIALPDWLNLVEKSEQTEPEESVARSVQHAALTPAFEESEQEKLSPGELPGWLQAIRPGNVFPEEDTRSPEMLPGAEELAGPLAGLRGVLPAEPEIVQFGKPPVFSTRLDISENQNRHAAVFSRLINQETLPKEDQGKRAEQPTRVLNRIIAGVLLVAAFLPLVTQSHGAPRPELNAFPESANVFNLIDTLPASAPVLVVFEVQPALYGEVKAPATIVLTHLLEKQARLVFLSTHPTGPALAERLLQEELASQPSIATGDYVNLGYLSGGLAALRSFSSDPRSATLSAATNLNNPWQSTTLQSIHQIGDFGIVLIISSDAEDARAWIEQTSAELSEGLAAVTSAQAVPLLRPYLQSNPVSLRGLVGGLAGAVYYERLRAQDGLGRFFWDAYSYGLGAMILLIIMGGLYGRLIQLKPEKAAGAANS